MISNIRNLMQELPHELLNDLKLKKQVNISKIGDRPSARSLLEK